MLRQDSTKRYNQLAVDLLKKILNRYYLPGSKLPSTRELAKQAGVKNGLRHLNIIKLMGL